MNGWGKIIWSLRAQRDRKEILTYWNERNLSFSYSRKLNILFKQALDFIALHPLIGRPTDMDNIRVKVVKDYLLIYEVTVDAIILHTIWNGRRNPQDV